MKDFIHFIRERAVMGFAVGFLLGGAVSKVVGSLVNDIINPLLGIVLGPTGNLDNYTLRIGKAQIFWGRFTSNVIDFLVIAIIVYFTVTLLKTESSTKKEKK